MTNNRLNALARETEGPDMRATWGASPAAARADKQESATALAVTLSKLTASDVALICIALGVSPEGLFHRSSHDS